MCPWAEKRVPIKGWKAEETLVKDKGRGVRTIHLVNSYHVVECPLFEEDKGMKAADIDDAATSRLIHDIVAFAIRDWKKANGVLKGGKFHDDSTGRVLTEKNARNQIDNVELFFKSRWFGIMCDIDPEKLIKALREGKVGEIHMQSKGGF